MNTARRFTPKIASQAFTLVELLVVIGIIAVLISILLPALGAVRRSARQTQCAANMRSIHQLLMIYTAENKGSYPWGYCQDPLYATDYHYVDSASKWRDWTTTVSFLANKNRAERDLAGSYGTGFPYKERSLILRCPEVDTTIFQLSTSYQAHPVIMPSAYDEDHGYRDGGDGINGAWRIAPSKMNDLYPDNAILWDKTSVSANLYIDNSGTHVPDAVAGAEPDSITESYIDNFQLMYPLNTGWRYTDRKAVDLFDGILGLRRDEPIYIDAARTPRALRYNTDIVTEGWPEQFGAPRFRHNRDKVCNVCFADGSVRGLAWDPSRNRLTEAGGIDNEFLRKYIMIKWHGGIPFRDGTE